MGRLTLRNVFGKAGCKKNGTKFCYETDECLYCKHNDEILERLAHYEDLEEQGRLIEVVRCKECWRYDTGAGYDGWGLCELYDQDRKDNDYCSFGELKELSK